MMRKYMTGSLAALLLAACTSDGPAPAPELSAAAPVAAAPEAPGPGGRMPSGRDLGVRSAVVAPNGAAATAHPLATQTALDVLKAGGSAVDAAIAANAMLGLVEPTANGIGGDLFAIVWDPKTEKLYGYNGSGRSPMDATLADMQAIADKYMDGKELPPHGTAPVTVPGTVDAWYALHERFGKRPMADNLQPAITYARNGAPIPEVIAYYWGRSAVAFPKSAESGMLEEFENARKTYFDPPPREGTLFRNPDLADTLEKIAEKGRNEFYKGIMAKDMAAYFSRIGGHLDYDDFAAHKGEWTEPFCVTYREDYKVCELGPNTQGIAALQMLQMLEPFDLRAMGFGSPDSLMAQVEAKRIAFADRARFYADPAFTDFDPQGLIDPVRAARQSALIDTGTAMATIPVESFGTITVDSFDGAEADAKLNDGDTTYLTVTDEDGMMVSLIQSNYRGMGSGLVADGMGFMFQDRGQLFSLDPNHPNVWAPGKRPFHTIIPAFAFKKDMPGCQVRATAPELACPFEPWLSFGLMGGGMQPQGHVQIILNLVDYDMGLQEAGDAARWEHLGGCEPTNALDGDPCEEDKGVIEIEGGIPEATKAELEARGHTVKYIRANAGGYQAIMRDFETGAWIAATEMRKDGNADGY
jgi:gamma-glutamyltranspeptidase/glutathione hydrolase